MDANIAMQYAFKGDTEYFEKVELDVIERVRDGRGRSVLHDAIKYNHFSFCKVICRRCPQLLYEPGSQGFTPLHQAAFNGRDEIVEYLLELDEKRKLLMMVNLHYQTALHSAIENGRLQSVKILIDADPSKEIVRMVDFRSETAMHYAVRKHELEIVKLLVDVDPDFEYAPNHSGFTPLQIACNEALYGDQKTEEIRKFLIEKQPAQYRRPKDITKWSLIHYVASKGQLAAVKEIIRFWPGCCEWVDVHGQNFVHVAAKCGQVNVVEYVLEQMDIADNVLNGQDLHGDSPLHLAMSSTDSSVAFALLHDARVSKLLMNKDGRNPLDVASETLLEMLKEVVIQFASKGDVDFFDAIKVDVFRNFRDKNGESVLSTAVAKGHLDCCKVILKRCRELLFETNKNGLSSFHIAVSNQDKKILEFLIRYEPEYQGARDQIIWEKNNWRSKKEEVLTKASNDHKNTALHLAVGGGHLQLVELLIEAGGKDKMLTVKNLHKETAMHMAVKGHHHEIVKMLVDAHPTYIYSTNDVVPTPLYFIAQQEAFSHGSSDPRAVYIRNFLIVKQPDQCETRIGISNWTLLHYATQQGDLVAIKYIIHHNQNCWKLVDTEGCNILHLAAKFNHVDVVKYFLTFENIANSLIKGKDKYGNTPAHVAKSCGNQGISDYLQNDRRFDKMSLNIKGEKASDMGPSVPFQCAEKGDLDFFKTIQVNVLLKSINEYGDSLLSVAVREGHLMCCKEISGRCRNLLYGRNNDGFSPLHMAVFHGKYEIVKLLIEADPTEKMLSMTDNHSETALHYAVKNHHLNTVEMIVEADSNIEYFANDSGDTPLLVALKEAVYAHDQTTVKIRSHLIEKQSGQLKMCIGEKRWTLLQYDISEHDLSAAGEIIKSCRDCLLLVDEDGRNVLHHAVSNESVALVNYILDIQDISDSVLNGQDKNGDTPLHLATAGENVNISLSLLYDKRVRKVILNNEEKSALEKIDFVYDLSRAKVEGFPDLVDIKELKDQSDFDLLVGALISTVSFTAGITVPGGFFSDGPNRGNAILQKKRTFEAFVVFNTIALVLSLYVVFSHFCLRQLVSKKSIQLQLQMATFSLIAAIFAMLLAFIMGSFAVFSISLRLSIAVCVICCCFFAVSGFSLWITIAQTKRRRRRSRRAQNH